jgi:hypothetical protein
MVLMRETNSLIMLLKPPTTPTAHLNLLENEKFPNIVFNVYFFQLI